MTKLEKLFYPSQVIYSRLYTDFLNDLTWLQC